MKEEEFLEQTLAFLGSLGIRPDKPKFYFEVNLDAKGEPSSVYSSDTDTVFRLTIRPDEWSVIINKPKKGSYVRVMADETFIHGEDKFRFVKRMPPITELTKFFRDVEKELKVKFPRVAFVRTNIAGGKKAIEKWVATL